MSTLTGNDVRGLMEAYQAVYAPQELTEEQVWEEVEEWVNTLIEEGYDLSDYTWEEMFESYLEEAPARNYGNPDVARYNQAVAQSNKDKATRSTAQGQVQTALGQGRGINVRGATTGTAQGRGFGAVSGGRQGVVVNKPLKPGETQQINVGGRTLFPAQSGNRTVYLPSKEAKPATPLFKSSAKPVPPVNKDKLVPPVDKDKPVPPTRTPAAAPAARPAAAAPAKVSPTPTPKPTQAGPTKPAIGTTAGGTKFERRAATSAELRAAKAARAAAKAAGDTKGAEEAAVKAGVEAGKSASKPAVTSRPSGFGVPTAPLAAKLSAATSTAPPTPTEAPKVAPSNTLSNTVAPSKLKKEEYDAYDLVLEYLLSQGHADTLEEANYVMLELDAEMIGSIIEAKVDEKLPEHKRSGARLNRYDNPSGALALGGGQQRARREEHRERRGKKTKG